MKKLEELELLLPKEVYSKIEQYKLENLAEEHLSKEWFNTRDIMQSILKKYNLADDDPYDLKS